MTHLYHHPTIPEFRAPAELWRAVGATVYANTEEVSIGSVTVMGAHLHGVHLLTEAWYRHQDGTDALLWFLAEKARRERENDDCRALQNMASAIKFASSSMHYDIDLVMAKLPPRLRERVCQLAGI